MPNTNQPRKVIKKVTRRAPTRKINVGKSTSPLISVIIPTYNSHKFIASVLDAIHENKYPHLEIIVVDDNSTDHTLEIVETYRHKFKQLSIIVKPKDQPKGAAISTNMGIKQAKGEIVCSIDSDAIVSHNWFKEVAKQFKQNKDLGAVAGQIYTGNKEIIWANFMGAELEDRYDHIQTQEVDHVSTCNTAYRKKAIEKAGYLDEELYYGYDVDISYKIRNNQYKIKLLKNISCEHYWKESLMGYLKQQVNVAYARLQLIKKYPQKKSGDKVAGLFMFMQVPLTALFYGLVGLGILSTIFVSQTLPLLLAAITMLVLLAMQIPQTIRLIKKRNDFSFLLFPFFILMRNTAWCYAVVKYYLRF